MRKWFVALITFIGGAFFLLEFVLPTEIGTARWAVKNPLTPHLSLVTDIIVVLVTMALLLGPLNLVLSHAKTLIRQRQGWIESATFLVFLVGGIVIATRKELVASEEAVRLYKAIFDGLLAAFGKTSMGLLAFYLASAAYRSFRLHNLDSGVMMIAAVIVLLGLVPLGGWLTGALPEWAQLPGLAGWVLATPNTAVQRAVAIGACAGAFAAGMRHWLSIGTRGA